MEHLLRREELGWIRTLANDLAEVEGLLEQFPLAGIELAREEAKTLRRLRLRHAPFSVWHSFDESTGRDGPVVFLRFFHAKQRTPQPRLP